MKKVFDMDENQRTTIANGLRVASERFFKNASDLESGDYRSVGGFPLTSGDARAVAIDRLAKQFRTQAEDSLKVATLVENADEITPWI